MIIVYNTTTGEVVDQGLFNPEGNIPEGCAWINLDRSGPLIGQKIDPVTLQVVPMDGRDPYEREWRMLRKYRNDLLAASDYLLAPDYGLTEESYAAVVAYRKALRNITKAATPDAVVWPEMPPIEQTPDA